MLKAMLKAMQCYGNAKDNAKGNGKGNAKGNAKAMLKAMQKTMLASVMLKAMLKAMQKTVLRQCWSKKRLGEPPSGNWGNRQARRAVTVFKILYKNPLGLENLVREKRWFEKIKIHESVREQSYGFVVWCNRLQIWFWSFGAILYFSKSNFLEFEIPS